MSDEATRVQLGVGDRSYTVPADVPVLPLRDTVLFPNSFMPLAVARESSVKLIDEAIAGGKLIGVFTQKDPTQEEPGQDDLHPTGTLTHIHKMFKLPDGSLRLIVQGLARLTLNELVSTPLEEQVHDRAALSPVRPARSIDHTPSPARRGHRSAQSVCPCAP